MATQPRLGWPGLRKSYSCAEAVVAPAGTNAGVLVERRAGIDLVGVAAAGSPTVCGVGIDDVPAVRATVTGHQVGDGHEMTVYSGGFVNVIAAAAVTEGQRLVAAAAGQVTPFVAATNNAAQIVGHADQAAAAGATVLVFIGSGGQG